MNGVHSKWFGMDLEKTTDKDCSVDDFKGRWQTGKTDQTVMGRGTVFPSLTVETTVRGQHSL